MLNGEEYYYSTSSSVETKCFPSNLNADMKKKKKKKKRSKVKKRFSEKQIKLMESMFESKSKLEPCKKLQLAEEIGLEPRQVAIWFQNKRARWKSKQLERDFNVLQDDYNALSFKLDELNKENQSLVSQLQMLPSLIEKKENDGKSKERLETKQGLWLDGSEHGVGNVVSDENSSVKAAEYLGIDEECSDQILSMQPGNWGNLEPNDEQGLLLDQSSTSYQWWNFWS